jgi:hypothetical protein
MHMPLTFWTRKLAQSGLGLDGSRNNVSSTPGNWSLGVQTTPLNNSQSLLCAMPLWPVYLKCIMCLGVETDRLLQPQ